MEGNINKEAIIYTHELTKSFDGTTAVNRLSIDISPGVIFGFIGPSGCGKTTCVRLLLGIYSPDSGEVQVMQRTPLNFGRSEKAQIGYMPQQFVLYPELSVWENLSFAASIYGVPLRRKERLDELLDIVELTGEENKKVRNLSGGMQRRLSLATSFVHNPRLLFLDEPTAGIDPVLRQKFWNYFQELKEAGCTLFVTTQYVGEAAHCDQVGVMADGRLLMVDTPAGLRRTALGGEVLRLRTADYLDDTQFSLLRNQSFVVAGNVERLRNRGLEITVDDAGEALPTVLEWFQNTGLSIESASESVPDFDDVFVELIRAEARSEEIQND